MTSMIHVVIFVLQGLGVIDSKIDRVLKFTERRSTKDARQVLLRVTHASIHCTSCFGTYSDAKFPWRQEKRDDALSQYAIARNKLKLDKEPFASGGSCQVALDPKP